MNIRCMLAFWLATSSKHTNARKGITCPSKLNERVLPVIVFVSFFATNPQAICMGWITAILLAASLPWASTETRSVAVEMTETSNVATHHSEIYAASTASGTHIGCIRKEGSGSIARISAGSRRFYIRQRAKTSLVCMALQLLRPIVWSIPSVFAGRLCYTRIMAAT